MRSNNRKAGKRLSVGEGVVAGSTLELRHTHSLLKDFMLQSYERLAVAQYALHLHCHTNHLRTRDNLLTSEVGDKGRSPEKK